MTITLTIKRLIIFLTGSIALLTGAVIMKPELGEETVDVHLDKDGVKITKSESSIETKE